MERKNRNLDTKKRELYNCMLILSYYIKFNITNKYLIQVKTIFKNI